MGVLLNASKSKVIILTVIRLTIYNYIRFK